MSDLEYAEMDFNNQEGRRIIAAANEMRLPPQGVAMMMATEKAIAAGALQEDQLMSAEELLYALADELEEDMTEANIRKIADKLRMLAVYATTHKVPIPLD